MRFRILLTASLLAAACAGAAASPSETAHAVAAKASEAAVKIEGTVKHGLGKAASAVKHGGAVAGRAVNRMAKKLGLPASAASAAR